MTKRILNSCLVALLLPLTSLYANTLAIIDSGVDYKHKDLADQMWENPGEIPGNRRDDDGNLFRDDVYGWNFAGSNNQVINYNYLGKFSDDPFKYLEIQGKYLKGEATAEEIEWMQEKRKEKEFIKEMGVFGNFAHGTHVARISSRLSAKSKIMAIKLLPTEAKEATSWLKKIGKDSYKLHKLFGKNDVITLKGGGGKKGKGKNREELLKTALKALVGQQAQMLGATFRYVAEQGATVMNGSFGTAFEMIKVLTDNAFRIIYLRKPTEAESDKTAKLYFKFNIDALTAEMKKYPQTLFIYAAGNSASNNDIFPSSPANVRLPNVMTVAATVENKSLAVFSNYGASNVDVAAPGVAILSAVPSESHSDQVYMSGTSQASPYVAGVASEVKVLNPELTPVQVKKIVMETVDSKDFLYRKVSTSGIVNSERAFFAATQSKTMDLDAAIKLANSKVQDVPSTKIANNTIAEVGGLMLNSSSSLGNLEQHQEELEVATNTMVKKIQVTQE